MEPPLFAGIETDWCCHEQNRNSLAVDGDSEDKWRKRGGKRMRKREKNGWGVQQGSIGGVGEDGIQQLRLEPLEGTEAALLSGVFSFLCSRNSLFHCQFFRVTEKKKRKLETKMKTL